MDITTEQALDIICSSKRYIIDGDTGLSIIYDETDGKKTIKYYDPAEEDEVVALDNDSINTCDWVIDDFGRITAFINDEYAWDGLVFIRPANANEMLVK